MGDPRYDVAKLYHSVLGLYDFITNDLFHVAVAGDAEAGVSVTLDIRTRPQHRQIRERFEAVFFGPRAIAPDGRPWFDRREILLITGLIFAGIPALHYDKPERQVAMLAKAMEIFGELYPAGNGAPDDAPATELAAGADGAAAAAPAGCAALQSEM